MPGLFDVPPDLLPLQSLLIDGLDRVRDRFDRQLTSDLPPVEDLVRHVERYRGKMLRPALAILAGLACTPSPTPALSDLSPDHFTVAAVCEMIHMATLVHDDILDEADTRRRGATVNRLHGNETAVILGDYLIASAFHLCSQLDQQTTALLVGHVSMTMCAGELLQLHHRDDFSLDRATYDEIVARKTAALIGLAAQLGAQASKADARTAERLKRFGEKLGIAFQIQDDLLDLTATEATVGKSVGKDLEKGKLTLPLIHHLAACDALARGRSLRLLQAATDRTTPAAITAAPGAAAELRAAIEATGSIAHARREAQSLIDDAKGELAPLADSPARRFLLAMADAVITRSF